MIIKLQTSLSEQVSLSKAEIAHITDRCQEKIAMCNIDSESSTTRALIAQGMYSFFNYFVKYCRYSPLNLFLMCHQACSCQGSKDHSCLYVRW